ncbi:MAG TPA: cytochrome c [Pirellulales bacterium]|jgi:mono/diheme cytochrome c family protein|nr:cytochrome c [Pirellulales bacterium]
MKIGYSFSVVCCLLAARLVAGEAGKPESAQAETQIERGYRLLTTKTYLPPDFDQQVFDELWKCWEEPLRSQAAKASPVERRKLAFSRYGLTEAPGREGGVALQYVDDGRGGWVMNCLACHGGKVAGKVVPGAPNTLYALETLTGDVRQTKLRMGKTLSHMDLGGAAMPLGTSIGTSNAVMFGVVLLNYRDADLNVHRDRAPPKTLHHDHDAPPWWNIKKKSFLYADGGIAKSHRALMQFLLLPKNGPEKFREWEQDYADILAWMESIEPPKYPFAIDQDLAARGEKFFVESCSRCHGAYGDDGGYPEKTVPIDEVDTDRARFEAIAPEWRREYGKSWFGHYGEKPLHVKPAGYVAPPLDGIWASAPYLHNGSVPTLWHLLNPDERPIVWQRSEDGYDRAKIGLQIEEFDELPAAARVPAEKRRYFDARKFGKSAAGHLFPDELTEEQKRAVLEYLKTL